MPSISWDPSMSTGVDSVDAQHRQLIAWLNDLLSAMAVGQGRAEIVELLNNLSGYSSMHFGHEEECMVRYNCPAAEANVMAHRNFVTTFAALKEQFDREGATAALTMRVEAELLRWLVTHIRGTDVQLAPCVAAAAKAGKGRAAVN